MISNGITLVCNPASLYFARSLVKVSHFFSDLLEVFSFALNKWNTLRLGYLCPLGMHCAENITISDYDALKRCIPICLISKNKLASEMTEQSSFNISWGGMHSWQIIFLRGVIQRTLFPLVLLVGVLKPLAVQQIEPRLCCLLSLCQLFLERWWGRRRRKRWRETDFTFSSHSYQGQHLEHNSDKERGSVIRLRALPHTQAHFIGISPSDTTTIMHAQSIFTTMLVS